MSCPLYKVLCWLSHTICCFHPHPFISCLRYLHPSSLRWHLKQTRATLMTHSRRNLSILPRPRSYINWRVSTRKWIQECPTLRNSLITGVRPVLPQVSWALRQPGLLDFNGTLVLMFWRGSVNSVLLDVLYWLVDV